MLQHDIIILYDNESDDRHETWKPWKPPYYLCTSNTVTSMVKCMMNNTVLPLELAVCDTNEMLYTLPGEGERSWLRLASLRPGTLRWFPGVVA